MSSRLSKKKASSNAIADDRFDSFETDPRFRLPSKRTSKTKVDKRFAALHTDEFSSGPSVDRYGRRIKPKGKNKALADLYEVSDNEPDDDKVKKELIAAEIKYDPARGVGFSSSEEETDDEEIAEEEGSEEQFGDEQATVEEGEMTSRLALCNFDFDRTSAVDVHAMLQSFLPAGERIVKVSILPSQYGREKLRAEEQQGPSLGAISKNVAAVESDVSDEDEAIIRSRLLAGGDEEDNIDQKALRSYQLDRLRYYFAVIETSSKRAAQAIYDECDGSEFATTSLRIDLRAIPEDMTFEEEPRETCEEVPEGYRPVSDWMAEAISHSKVKLTWDLDPSELRRKDTLTKAFEGSRKAIAENDLKAYLASDSSGAEDDEQQPKLKQQEVARRKLREALGLGADDGLKMADSGPVGDMEITFTPALVGDAEEDRVEETTLDKYKRKEREKKERRKEKYKEAVADATEDNNHVDEAGDDLGFDDPFFTSEPAKPSKSGMRKEERLKKRAAREAKEAEQAEQKIQLELLMADEGASKVEHFDIKHIMQAEKSKRKKGKKDKKGKAEDGELQGGFEMKVDDDRFKAVFENHEFAIDPSNPKFKATPGMVKLLDEGRKKRKARSGELHDKGRGDTKRPKC